MRTDRGFSLIELLLVVVVIGIIAALAIPNFLAARRAANEGSALSALRTIYGANVSFSATEGSGNYAGTAGTVGTSSLNDLAAAKFIDPVLGQGEKSGYRFVGNRTASTPTEPQTFYFSANPTTTTGTLITGTKRFGVSTDGVLHSDATVANLAVPFDAVSVATASPINNP